MVLLTINLLEGKDKMKRLLETHGKQVIIVTHSPKEAYRLCSSLRVMKNGDIIKEESQLITTGFAPAEQIFAYKKLGDNLYYLPGVLSRKKQLLPEISRILEEISK